MGKTVRPKSPYKRKWNHTEAYELDRIIDKGRGVCRYDNWDLEETVNIKITKHVIKV